MYLQLVQVQQCPLLTNRSRRNKKGNSVDSEQVHHHRSIDRTAKRLIEESGCQEPDVDSVKDPVTDVTQQDGAILSSFVSRFPCLSIDCRRQP